MMYVNTIGSPIETLLFHTAKLVIFGELSSLRLSVSTNAVLLTLFKQSTFRYSE